MEATVFKYWSIDSSIDYIIDSSIDYVLLFFCAMWNCVKERNRYFALPKMTNSPKISAFFIKIDRSKMDRNALMTIPELGLLDCIAF